MLTTLLSALCALALSSGGSTATTTSTPAAPADTTNRYAIDGSVIDSFDGSQLVGKTVRAYEINILNGKKEVIRLHNISTTEASHAGEVRVIGTGVMNNDDAKIIIRESQSGDAVFVVDGKVISAEELHMISPSEIISMEIIKDNASEIKKKYTDKKDAGVVIITTRNGK